MRPVLSMMILLGIVCITVVHCGATDTNENQTGNCTSCGITSGEATLRDMIILAPGPYLSESAPGPEGGGEVLFYCDSDGGSWTEPESGAAGIDSGFDSSDFDAFIEAFFGFGLNTISSTPGISTVPEEPEIPENGCNIYGCDCTKYASVCPGSLWIDQYGTRHYTNPGNAKWVDNCCGNFVWNTPRTITEYSG